MKLITAIVRPEKVMDVIKALEQEGYFAFSKWAISGRGKEKGIQVGDVLYQEMAKNMLYITVGDKEKYPSCSSALMTSITFSGLTIAVISFIILHLPSINTKRAQIPKYPDSIVSLYYHYFFQYSIKIFHFPARYRYISSSISSVISTGLL